MPVELKVVAMQYGAVQIDWTEESVAIKFGARAKVDGDRILTMIRTDRNVRLLANGTVRVRCEGMTGDRITLAMRVLHKIVGTNSDNAVAGSTA